MEIAIENEKGVLSVWNVIDTGSQNRFDMTIKQEDSKEPTSSYIVWSPDSEFITTRAYNPKLKEYQIVLVDSGSRRIVSSFSGDNFGIQNAFAWSPDGRYIAAKIIEGSETFTMAIFPSYEDDWFLDKMQNDSLQGNQLDLWYFVQLLVMAETGAFGIIALYTNIIKSKFHPQLTIDATMIKKSAYLIKRCLLPTIIVVFLIILITRYDLIRYLPLTKGGKETVSILMLSISVGMIIIIA